MVLLQLFKIARKANKQQIIDEFICMSAPNFLAMDATKASLWNFVVTLTTGSSNEEQNILYFTLFSSYLFFFFSFIYNYYYFF